ncbi:MAG: hypothetical protein WEB30_19640 [Cyclobacteriaceae bacterium]
MRKLLLAVCLMFGGATLVSAQDQSATTDQTQTTPEQDQDRQEITASELPEAVSAKLESADFSGWTVENCYKKTGENNMAVYIVELKQGTETKKVKFDADGNKLEHDKKDKSYDKADQEEAKPDQQ